jgi:hypothetical protein
MFELEHARETVDRPAHGGYLPACQKAIADRASISEDTARRHISKLDQLGYVDLPKGNTKPKAIYDPQTETWRTPKIIRPAAENLLDNLRVLATHKPSREEREQKTGTCRPGSAPGTFRTLKCPECGSTDVELRCRSCGCVTHANNLPDAEGCPQPAVTPVEHEPGGGAPQVAASIRKPSREKEAASCSHPPPCNPGLLRSWGRRGKPGNFRHGDGGSAGLAPVARW